MVQGSQPAQAGPFDSEREAAKELAKKGFTKAAGAAIERRLKEVCPERLPEKRCTE